MTQSGHREPDARLVPHTQEIDFYEVRRAPEATPTYGISVTPEPLGKRTVASLL